MNLPAQVWWVQRTRYNFIVQKKKPFKVTNPTCTYDDVRGEYLPYALIVNGTLVATVFK